MNTFFSLRLALTLVCRCVDCFKIDFQRVSCPVSSRVSLLGAPCSCFFRAISQAVSGSQNHYKIRLAICKQRQKNADKYSSVLCSQYSSVTEYVAQSKMDCVYSWATEEEIQAASDCLGLNVYTFVNGH